KMNRKRRQRAPSTSSETEYTYSSSTSVAYDPIAFSHPVESLARAGKYAKLIALYADHECLWNQFHQDFFNLALKERIWEAIADEMELDSSPEYWKHMIYKLRYKVELQRLHEREARFLGEPQEEKLYYSDNLQFLNHMFSRGKKEPPRDLSLQGASSGVTLDKRSSRTARPTRIKPKPRVSFVKKIAAFEHLRNHPHSKFVLSREAFHKMQKVTGEGVKFTGKVKPKG
ncbi:hypothetical protein KR018_007477, partial [Drosophila ironensis]